MTDTNLAFLSISELSRLIRAQKITSQRITEIYLNRIKQYNPLLNAIVINMEEEALRRAKAADDALSNGKLLGKLHGVPVTVKEAFNITGYKTTVNFKQLKNNVAQDDADLVNSLYNEGAVILGKTNIPTLLGDHQTYGPLYPRANNPFDLARTPGGSTGGGASAVAAGLTGIEVGSDIGGSLRIPAHFCGVYGLKTTEGAVSLKGHVPPLPNAKGAFRKMGVLGPLARNLEDLELIFEIIKKQDITEAKGYAPDYSAFKNSELADVKLAWTASVNDVKTGSTTLTLLKELVDKLSGQVQHIEQTLPKINYQEAERNWANIFGYFMGQDMPWMIRQIIRLQYCYSPAFRPKGNMIAEGVVGTNQVKLEKFLTQRQEFLEAFQSFFKEYTFILTPMGVGPAFEHRKTGTPIDVEGRKVNYWDMCLPFTFLANVLGFPALVLPMGKSKEGLPIGLQIMGPYHSEKQLIQFAKHLQPFVQGFQPPKDFG